MNVISGGVHFPWVGKTVKCHKCGAETELQFGDAVTCETEEAVRERFIESGDNRIDVTSFGDKPHKNYSIPCACCLVHDNAMIRHVPNSVLTGKERRYEMETTLIHFEVEV